VAKTPPPAAPVSFVRQQQEIQANGGRPPAISQMRQPRGGNDAQPRSNIRMAPPATAMRRKTAGAITGPASSSTTTETARAATEE